MDDCLYSLDSDPRSARQEQLAIRDDDEVEEQVAAAPAPGAGPGHDVHNESSKGSQVASIDKSGLSRESHYTAGQKPPQNPYEGGSRRSGSNGTRERDAAGKNAMNLFKGGADGPLGANHVGDVGQEMRDRGSKEKSGFMEKEAEFSK